MKSNLVIAASGRAVKQHTDILRLNLREHRADRDGPSDARRIPVTAFVPRLRLYDFQTRLCESVLSLHNLRALRAAAEHALLHGIEALLVGLSEVNGVAVHGKALALQPVRNCATVQTTGHRACYMRYVAVLEFTPVHS